MTDIHRTRSGVIFNANEMPPLPLKREEVKDKKDEKKEVPISEIFMSYYRLLKECPERIESHVLEARKLQWAHGFDPINRDKVDVVQIAFLHDYGFAKSQKADAFKVAREMLKYQMPVSEDASELIKRDEQLDRLIKAFPFKKSGKPRVANLRPPLKRKSTNSGPSPVSGPPIVSPAVGNDGSHSHSFASVFGGGGARFSGILAERAGVPRYFAHSISTDDVSASVHDDFDFRSDGVLEGQWLRNEALRSVITNGFSCGVDTRHLGHLPSKLRVSNFDEQQYISALLRDGVISLGQSIFSHRHFFLRNGGKLRLIFDGRRLNSRVSEPHAFPMLSHRDLASSCARRSWAAKFDLANFYWNIRLHPSIRHLFGLRTSVGNFVWNRLPFGFSHSALQSHHLAEAICLHLRTLGIDVVHYMDDFIVFADSAEQCERHLLQCISFCESINVRVKARKTVHATQRPHILGVRYDLVAKTSSLDRSYFDRLSRDLVFLDSVQFVKRARFASFLGAALFCNAAYPGALSFFNDVIRCFNSTSHLPWTARIDVAAGVRLASVALEQVSLFPPCALQSEGRERSRVFADATPTQLGVVIDGVLHAQPIAELPIFEAEASALALALVLANRSPITLVTDNRALFCAVRKGRSGNQLANTVIRDILLRRLGGAVVDVEWIPSSSNPADIPSRAIFDHDSRDIIFHI